LHLVAGSTVKVLLSSAPRARTSRRRHNHIAWTCAQLLVSWATRVESRISPMSPIAVTHLGCLLLLLPLRVVAISSRVFSRSSSRASEHCGRRGEERSELESEFAFCWAACSLPHRQCGTPDRPYYCTAMWILSSRLLGAGGADVCAQKLDGPMQNKIRSAAKSGPISSRDAFR